MKQFRLYGGYEHWTLEPIPRPYYVGIGAALRCRSVKRNAKHKFIRTALGLDRRLVIVTSDYEALRAWEIRRTAELDTFTTNKNLTLDDIRCNFTKGGKGVTGTRSTEEDRLRRSKALIGRIPWNKGRRSSELTRRRQSESHKGLKMPARSNAWKEKQRRSQKHTWQSKSVKLAIRNAKIYDLVKNQGVSYRVVSEMFGLHLASVYNIIYHVRKSK